ncbi:MAG: hypothetical protein M3513_16315 [Actinomycetota bacterium]|nr:hypothetical protein [Actinomycetota bacterium]
MERHSCGLLAAWGTAWLAGRVPYDAVIDAVVGSASHRVRGLPGHPQPVPLGWLLTAAREHGERRLLAVLPAPGDPRGLPGPGAFTAAALHTGAAVRGATLGVVPETIDAEVLWTAFEVEAPPSAAAEPVPVSEADEQLQLAVRMAADALTRLDVASWRPDLASLRAPERGPQLRMPPGHDQRALGLLDRARRLAEILDLAFADAPGGAVTSGEAGARDAALRPLAAAVRHALAAAYNASRH